MPPVDQKSKNDNKDNHNNQHITTLRRKEEIGIGVPKVSGLGHMFSRIGLRMFEKNRSLRHGLFPVRHNSTTTLEDVHLTRSVGISDPPSQADPSRVRPPRWKMNFNAWKVTVGR